MDVEQFLNSLISVDVNEEQKKYARVTIELDNQNYIGTDLLLTLYGDYLGVITYTGDGSNYFRLGSKRNPKIYCTEVSKIYSKFDKIYFTNTSSQSGKVFTFFVGGAYVSELNPSSTGKVGLTDVLGASINPTEEDGNISAINAKLTSINNGNISSIDYGIQTLIPDATVYRNSHTMTNNGSFKFETSPLIVHDMICRVKTQGIYVGNNASQDVPFSANEDFGFTECDLSTLYFYNGSGSQVYILGSRR